ncbi:MAG: ABC-F family ATP-binding cassette domain-containing protein, partial [Clostridia bacterium]
MIIKLTNAGFTYGGDKYIFENVNLEINNTDKIGLVGINGTGKSTLLNCITGEFILCDGEIYKKNGLSIGYLRQNSGLESSSTVYDELLSVFNDVFQIEKKLHALSAEMSTLSYESREYKECADKYNRLTNEFSAKDGYNVEVKVKTILNGMGLSEFYDRVIDTLSGGEKTKVALTKLLLISPELLILDEPTNHLDLETLAWLERFLSGYKGAILVVSHDRYFLDKLVNRIWDFEQKTVTDYYANYSKFKTLKTEKFLSWQREYDKQQLQIAKMQDYIDRNGVRASTANMAKSREKQLAQMDVIAKPYVPPRRPRFAFKFSTDASENVLEVRNLTLEYPNRTLLTNQSFIVKRGNKVALLGANGTGKSTLIKKIVNFEPTNGGKIIFGHNVKFSYYDQENLNFSNDGTVMDVMWDIN